MLRRKISAAVYGMLHYYGVMPVADVFVLSHRYGLCGLSDYAFFQRRIQEELVEAQKVYVYKNCLCHKWVRNPAVVEAMQRETVASGYKRFSLQAYTEAVKAEMVWSEPFCRLQDFLKQNTVAPAAGVQRELVRLWRELSNIGDLVSLTGECVDNLRLPWRPEEYAYMHLLEELQNVVVQMPQWRCKGYSYQELGEREKESKEIC